MESNGSLKSRYDNRKEECNLKKQTRIEWVDIGKYICIMFVMATHLSYCPSSLRTFFTPFFLPLFFFLSGYVYKNNSTFGDFVVKKVRTLLVPWFIFSLLIIITGQIMSFNEHTSLKEELVGMFLQIRGKDDTMWFVVCLFVAFIPFYFIIRYMQRRVGIIVAFILSSISIIYCQFMNAELLPWKSAALPWHIQTIFVAMLLMMAGYYFKLDYEKKFARFVNIRTFFIALVVYLGLIYIEYFITGRSLGINEYGKVFFIYWYLTVASGIVLCIIISKLVKPNKYISFVGANTLTYFGLHGKLEGLVEKLLSSAGILNKIYNSVLLQYILCIFTIIVISVVLIIPAMIINRYFPFVLGKWYKKNIDKRLTYKVDM